MCHRAALLLATVVALVASVVASGCLTKPSPWTPDMVAAEAGEGGPACGENQCGGGCGQCAAGKQCTYFGWCVSPGTECDPDTAAEGTCDLGWIDDTLVNTEVIGGQCAPDIAATGDGGFVVVWSSCPSCGTSGRMEGDPGSGEEPGQDGQGCGIYAQRFTQTGKRAGGEFRVNTNWKRSQFRPSVAGLNGGFGVAWLGWYPDDEWNVYFQLFNSDGEPLGEETRVTDVPPLDNYTPRLAITDAAQGVALAWIGRFVANGSDVVLTRRYGFDWGTGTVGPTSGIETVAPPIPALEWCGIAPIGNEHYVVTWVGNRLEQGAEEAETGVDSYARVLRFDGTASAYGDDPFLLTADPGECDAYPSLDGFSNQSEAGFAATFASSSAHIMLRKFPEEEIDPQPEVLVASEGSYYVDRPDVAAAADGSFMVVWQRGPEVPDQSQEWGVFAQRLGADLKPIGEEIHVNHYIPEEQYGARVAALGDGGFAVVWQSCANQDGGGGCGIFAQAFDRDGKKCALEPPSPQP